MLVSLGKLWHLHTYGHILRHIVIFTFLGFYEQKIYQNMLFSYFIYFYITVHAI